MIEPQQGGYVKAYRRCWKHAAFRDKLDAAIWNYLYQNAVWEDTIINHYGESINLTRGQILISCRELAKDFCTTESRVRTLTEHLAKHAMIDTQRTHRGTIITICNYEKYQHLENAGHAQGESSTQRSPSTARQFANIDNKTNETNETTTLAAKAEFRQVYEFGSNLFSNLATANTYEIHRWLQAGCSIQHDIIPSIKRCELKNVNSWSYFSGAIMDAKANREKPLPKGNPHDYTPRQTTESRSKSSVQLAIEATERARAARERRSAGPA